MAKLLANSIYKVGGQASKETGGCLLRELTSYLDCGLVIEDVSGLLTTTTAFRKIVGKLHMSRGFLSFIL